MLVTLLILLLGVTGVALFGFVLRPWYVNWGATREEATRPLPGDDLIPRPRLVSTRAVVIHAPADKVWPWLVQLGYGRAGWYNHDWINAAMGVRYYEGTRSSSRILPQFQNLKVGDVVPLNAPDSGWEVVSLEPNRLMILTAWIDVKTGRRVNPGDPPPAAYIHSSQVYVLEELDRRTTRFIVRDRLDWELGRANLLGYVLEPGYFLQESAFMQGVKKRAEALQPTS